MSSTQVALTSLSKRFHFTPSTSLSNSPRSANAPKLIILFAWMGAKIPHIQKYINGYSSIWPSTPIIVVQSLPHDFRPLSTFASEYGPLKSLISNHGIDLAEKSDGDQVLMITMSNGGCWSAKAFLDGLGHAKTIYPRAIIHDSGPTVPSYTITLRAFLIAGKYRLFSKAIAAVVITVYYYIAATVRVILRHDPIGDMRRALVERMQPTRRSYIYSKEDALINWRDVENHARAAEKASDNVVRAELFHGSAHVQHLRQDEKRYWKIVQETWDPTSESDEIVAPEAPVKETEKTSTLDDSYIDASASTLSASATQSTISETPTVVPEGHATSQETEIDDTLIMNTSQNTTQIQEEALDESVTAKESESAKEESEAEEEEEEDAELDSSILGTKEYWDKFYARERTNYAENSNDEGEIWFGEESEDKIINYLVSPSSSYSPTNSKTSVLDLGTGNGHLLFTLHEAGFEKWKLTGIDYSANSIALANAILSRKKYNNMEFRVQDFLNPSPQKTSLDKKSPDQQQQQQQQQYDLVLDKGTFDAISLSDEQTPDGQKLSQTYAKSVVRLLKKDAKLIITSCNWTREELTRRMTQDGLLKVHAYFKTPKQAFQFGGKTGSTTSQVVFTRL